MKEDDISVKRNANILLDVFLVRDNMQQLKLMATLFLKYDFMLKKL